MKDMFQRCHKSTMLERKKHGKKWFGSRTLFTLEAEEEVLPPEGKAELLWLVLPAGWVRWYTSPFLRNILQAEASHLTLKVWVEEGHQDHQSLNRWKQKVVISWNCWMRHYEAPWIWAGIAGKGATKRIHIVTLIFTMIYNSKASCSTTNLRCQIALDISI